MAFIIKDRVKEGTTTTGTGAITLGGASSTFDPFNSYMTNGDTSYYALVHTTTGVDEWEVGLGTWNTGNTLTRTTVLSGSNGTSPVDFSTGTKEVFMTYPASKAVALDAAGSLHLPDGLSVMGVIDGATSLEVETHIDLNTTELNKPAHNEGRIFYDAAFGALAVYNDEADITLQVGQEEYIRVKNNTGDSILNGTPVYLVGEDSGTPTVAVARADGTYNESQSVGIATHDIENNSVGYITVRGLISGLDTSHLTVGEQVHIAIGASGGTQTAAPSYPYYATDVGVCLISSASGGLLYVAVKTHAFETLRVTGNAHFDANVTVAGDLTVLGTQTVANSENIALSGAFSYFNSGDTIGDANTVFAGAGLDDAVLTGHYEGTTTNKSFYVKIDATGTPDTFSWSTDNFATTEATGVAITGADQALEDGISVTFNATTGHTVGDVWNGSASPVNVDSGIASNRNTGTSGVGYTHMGMYYDVSTNKWTFFDEYDPEPEGNIDTTDSSFSLATIKAGTFEGDLDGNVTGDVTGNVAGNVTGSLTGNVTGNVTGSSGSSTGNAATATKLATARTVQLTGDVTGSATFDGSANISINVSVQDDSHAHTIGNVDGLQTALDSKTPTSRVITAGNGLTGGGDLTANRTFTVGGGTGVTVNSNGIAIGQDVATTATPTFAGLTTTANVFFGDNDKAIFGAGSDLQIYHDGSTSWINETNATGSLVIRATDLLLEASNGNNYLFGDETGPVTLYHLNSPKLATTATGIDVTGTVTADGLTVDGNIDASGHVDAGNAYSLRWGDGNERITGNNTGLIDVFTNNTKRLNVNSNGDISFYEDTGTTPKFFWDASAERLGIGTSSPDALLHTSVSFGTSAIFGATNTGYGASNEVIIVGGSDTNSGLQLKQNGLTNSAGALSYIYNQNNAAMLFGTNNTERMRIASSGNVGIGTTTPDAKLEVQTITNIDRSEIDGLLRLTGRSSNEWGALGPSAGTALEFYNSWSGSNPNSVARISGRAEQGYNGGLQFDVSDNTGPGQDNFTTAMNILSNGYVGIGTDSPSEELEIASSSPTIRLTDTNDATYGAVSYNVGALFLASAQTVRFNTVGLERMRIDNSGNLLVGKSGSGFATQGIELQADGDLTVTRSAARPLLLNRLSTDGDIAEFFKNTSPVGSIGTQGSKTYIGTGDAGLLFNNTDNRLDPCWPTNTGATTNGTLDLGGASSRFKDLYLSGNTYVNSSKGITNSGSWTRLSNPYGYIDFGPANASWAHIYTDRPNFYFNRELYVNNNKVWNAGNDGVGSGLDADLLDGLQGSSYLRSDAADIMQGNLSFSTNANIHRNSHSSGYLVGSYNNIGTNSAKSNPIYTIGNNYKASDTSLNSMYGIGYTTNGATFGNINTVLDGWGLYVAAAGVARIGLSGSTGRVYATSYHGDGSNLTGVSSPTTTGAVGTYAFLWEAAANTTAPGTSRAGSGLRYGNAGTDGGYGWAGYGGTAPSGTWRCMGHTSQVNGGPYSNSITRLTLWVRIS